MKITLISIIFFTLGIVLYYNVGNLENIDSKQNVSIFEGTWVYKTDTYDFQITFFKDLNGTFQAYYSIAAQSGNRLDIGDKTDTNISFKAYDISNNLLNITLTSGYSDAIYKATLKKLSSETLEFQLGSAVVDDVNFFPSKPTLLTKQ